MKFVIIGNSAAGVGCAEGIRRLNKTDEIVMIGEENRHTYSRPLISYLLEGKTDEQRMKYRPDDFYEKNGIQPLLGVKVTAVHPDKKEVETDRGETIRYDKLLYAAGSVPLIPPTDGYETVQNKFTFMSLDDALALQRALSKNSRVLIIGAGLIGLKCAEGIRKLCGEITVVDMADRVLSSILERETAPVIQNHIEKQGVKFLLSDCVKRYDGNTALLQSGKKIEFDVLVTCVGVRPNVQLLQDVGAEIDRGVVVTAKSETNIADVYAAGDCTACKDVSSGQRKVLALLPNAYKQGETAGINMAGGDKSFADSIPMNAIGFFGLHMITAGSYCGDVWEKQSSDGSIKKLYYRDNLLKGFILIGNVEKAGIYTSMIKDRTPLDTVDFELIRETPGLMAFSKKYRDEKLGGIHHGY